MTRVLNPVYDAEREARLRDLLLEFALGIPSGKQFDRDEMELLEADVRAMVKEIDSLRVKCAGVNAIEQHDDAHVHIHRCVGGWQVERYWTMTECARAVGCGDTLSEALTRAFPK